MKAVATNFPPDRRGRVVGLLNAAPNVAAMLTPLAVAALFPGLGWRGTISVVGMLGVVCAAFWFAVPLPRSAAAEPVAVSLSPRGQGGVPARRIIAGFAVAKFLTDPVWWFLLFWLPDILHRRYGLNPVQLGVPVAVAYAMAAGGSVLGGYMPPFLARFGWEREGARRLVMGVAALCVLPLPLVLSAQGVVAGIALCGLALAAHQTFAANLFGFATEWLPPGRVGRGTGIGAFCGNIGGALALHVVGRFAGPNGTLLPVFLYCAVAYLLGWIALQMLAPCRILGGGKRPVSPALPPGSQRASPAR